MADENIQEHINSLRDKIREHNTRYYHQDAPTISDRAYDTLYAELVALEEAHPEFASPDSPTQQVGAAITDEDNKISHASPMLSISNAYEDSEVIKFCRRVESTFKETGEDVEFLVELKIDGLAISILYEDGKLTRGATRGDGRTGEKVTENVRVVGGIPNEIRAKDLFSSIPQMLEVRGEIYLPRAHFEALRTAQEEAGADRVFANPRNAAAGTLKLKDKVDTVRERGLAAWIYSTPTPDSLNVHTQLEALTALADLGFPINPERKLCKNANEILAYRDEIDRKRRELPYDTDGLVIKVNSLSQQEALGYDAKSPRWALAYKFEPEQAETRVTGIRLQVGKFGTITPVADLEPAFLSGSTISHASLHNASYIEEKDIRIGDWVLIEKAGEIIPQVSRSLPQKRSGEEKPFTMVTECPICDAPLHQESSERREPDGSIREIRTHSCTSPTCPAQVRERILHFCSRDAMDIDAVGPALIDMLLREQRIKSPVDLYTLQIEELAILMHEERKRVRGDSSTTDVDAASTQTALLCGKEDERNASDLPRKQAQNIVEAIQKSRSQGLARVLTALSIPHIGTTTAQQIAQKFSSIDEIEQLTPEQLSSMPVGESTSYRTLGRTTARKLHEHLQQPVVRDLLQKKTERPLVDVLTGLSIQGFGEKRCEAVAAAFSSAQALLDASEQELSMIELGSSNIKRTLGDVAANSLLEWIHIPSNAALLDELRKAGVKLTAQAVGGGAVAGKTFVITGTLPGMERAEAKRMIQNAGGIAAGSISRKTDYLVAGEKAGSKLEKAESYGVRIISADELRDLCNS